jgi:hypothetical protein
MCKFCEPEKYMSLPTTSNILKFNPNNSKMKMQGNKILMEFELDGIEYEATMTVNYCPQCGRKLTEAK